MKQLKALSECDLTKSEDRQALLYHIIMGAAEEVNFDRECCEKFVFDNIQKDLKDAIERAKTDLYG